MDTTDPVFDIPLPSDMTVECDSIPAAATVNPVARAQSTISATSAG